MTSSKSYSQIVLPDNPPASAAGSIEHRLRALAEDIEWHRDIPSNEDKLLERVKNADAIISSRAIIPLTDRVISSCSKLKIIARAGTGVDHIGLVAATKNGITVTNSPGCATPYAAEHALALALATCRQIVENDRHIRQGGWTRGFINALYGKTLGVVGTGAIGQRMVQLGQRIGMRVIAWTVHPSPQRAAEYGVNFVSLEELLQDSDVVSLHVELTALTEKLIGQEQLSLMPPPRHPGQHCPRCGG